MKTCVTLMTKRTLLSTLLVAGSLYGGYVVADEKNFGVQTPSVNEFVDALAQPPQPQLRFRGIKRISAAVESTPEPVAVQPEVSSVSMQLQFEFDSSRLTQSSKESLDNLSAALITDELQKFRFAIAGYTDASGSDYYNQTLSERRAASVKNYLVYRHSIDESRLDVVGLGEKDLLDASNPNSEINRRVAIRNLGAIAVAAVSE
ncbi:MAG: OmpA family protein [Gammaproteobacteria bacterium]|nr:OmpA family protein [Gammaproteobacteria bacterium]